MIDLGIRCANELGLTHEKRPYFKSKCFGYVSRTNRLLREARFVDGLRRPLLMCEARFICITDSRTYHLVTDRKLFFH